MKQRCIFIGSIIASLLMVSPALARMPKSPGEVTGQDGTGVRKNGLTAHPMDFSTKDNASAAKDTLEVYTKGSHEFTPEDIIPVLSSSSGYAEKWEFFIYTMPYEVRLKFEISNFAFSKNEGKVKGYVKKYDENGNVVKEYSIKESYKSGQWSAAKDSLSLVFGNYRLRYENHLFYLDGVFEDGDFSFEVPENFWKPGTGNVVFGDSDNNVFRYGLLAYHHPVKAGVVHICGETVENQGPAYANHYVTTVAVYDMFNEVADFRRRDDRLHVEFRYYVPGEKYRADPFGFLFVAYDGVPVFSSTDIKRTPLETWLDDAHYGYEIDSRQRIEARDGSNSATFEMLRATPRASDPYEKLPAFQRNVASRFSKPIEYSISIDWELMLDVDGMTARIPKQGTYSMTRFH